MAQKITLIQLSLWLTCLLLVPVRVLQAQVYTQQVVNADLSRYGVIDPVERPPTLTVPPAPVSRALTDDQQRAQKGLPLRVGIRLPVSLDVLLAAEQSDINGLRVSTYRVNVPGAVALSILFDQLQLAAGARLFVYDADRTMLVGPITAQQNGTGYWTDFVTGPDVLIEVQEPLASAGSSVVHVSGVIHGYRNLTGSTKSFGTVGGSGSCEVNMVCQSTYQPEGDGVALILVNYDDGTYICTGSMVNSTRQDFRSYFLTAFHCVDFNGDGTLSSGETAAYTNAQFRFNWQSPTCTPSQADMTYVTLTGGALRAAYSQSDFSLFELLAQAPPAETISYLGWNHGSTDAGSVSSIHHPLGDVKKISFGGATTVSGYGTAGMDHLTAYWTTGATEGGSSGAPLFDQNRRIIGQLHGGPSYCGAPAGSLKDYYGRFYTSWSGSGLPGARLADFLDPDNAEGVTLDGAKATISGPDSFTGSASFALNTGPGTSVAWSVSNGMSAVTTISGSGSTANLVASNAATNTPVTIVFTVNAGQTYPIQFSRTVTVTAGATGSSPFAFLPPLYDCATGAITFRTTGGNDAPVEYRAIGVTDWTSNANQIVEGPVRGDGQPLTLMARQSGVEIATPFDFRGYCVSLTPPGSTTQPAAGSSALTLLPPTYECTTGALTFRITGGDGTLIEYRAVGVTDWTITPNQVVEGPVRGDGQPLTMMARQSGMVVTTPFDFRAYCRPVGTRLSVIAPETEADWQVRILGNPTLSSVLCVEVRGVAGQSLRWQLIDIKGQILEERSTTTSGAIDQQQFTTTNQPAGVLLLRVSTLERTKVIRVLKTE